MLNAETVYRDFETDGVPSSGPHKVKKAEARELLTTYELGILGASAGSVVFKLKSAMDANLSYGTNTMAWVIGDPVAANNGIYQKDSAPGLGEWDRVGDLPYSFIRASDVGAGTPNAIIATTSIALPTADAAALIALNIFEDNTGSPVTVALNGGDPLTMKSISGADIVAGGLTAGMIVAGYVSGSTFRLLSDQTSAAFQAIVEGLVEDAEAAADAAIDAASAVQINTFADIAAVEAFEPAVAPNFLITVGSNDPDDDGGATYVNPVTSDPGKTDQIVINAGGVTPTYYNRLHKAGEVDFAKHGMFLDGREEVALFEDTFAVALDRGLSKLVMPGGKSLLLTEAVLPAGSFDVDFRGSTLLGDFNGALLGGTANLIRARNPGTPIGDLTASSGLAAAFDNVRNSASSQCASKSALSGYIGWTLPVSRPVYSARVWGSNNAGYYSGANPSVTLSLYGKTGSAPTTLTDGTLLGSVTFTDTADESAARRIVSNSVTPYTHVWIAASAASGTALFIAEVQFSLGAGQHDLILRGLDLDGQYDGVTTLTAENRILDVEGYGKFQLLDGWKLRNCGRGGTTELIIFDRSDKAISVHNCLEATVLDGTMRGNAKFEELVITSDNADCLATVMRVRGYNHISSGSPFNILNCAPGTTLAYCRAEGGYTGSGVNFLTKHGRVIANWFKGMSSSNGIDCHEGLFYADGTLVGWNLIENCSNRAIFGGGSGFQAIGNRTNNCMHGVCVETAIGAAVADYGPWMQVAGERRLAGIKLAGNTSSGHNQDNLANNSDYRIFGTATSPIEVELAGADGEYPSIKSEYGVWTRYATIKASGRFMHGRTGGFHVDLGDNELVLENASIDMEPGQSSDPILLTGGTLKVHWGKGTKRTGTLDAGFFDIARRSGGTMTSIDIDPSCADPTITGQANTRITKGNRMQVRRAMAYTDVAAGARQSIVLTVEGVATTDDVVCQKVTATALDIVASYASAANQVTVEIENDTAALIAANTINVRLAITAAGYDRS